LLFWRKKCRAHNSNYEPGNARTTDRKASYRQDCHRSTSTPAREAPSGSTIRQLTKRSGSGVGEHTMKQPFSVRGPFMRQNGPSNRATRKRRRLPLLRRQTGVEKPIAPENRTRPSLWAPCVSSPMRLRKLMPCSYSSSVSQTSRQKACRWATRPVMTSRSHPSPFDIATSTAGVTSSWRSIKSTGGIQDEVVAEPPHG
jgi:hypothetical protein